MKVKDRINEFIRFKNLSIKAFEEKIGSSNGSWNKAETISEDVLIRFLETFPEISLEWLFRGQGDMIQIQQEAFPLERDNTNEKLLCLCKSLVENYQQRDLVLSELVSIVKGKS